MSRHATSSFFALLSIFGAIAIVAGYNSPPPSFDPVGSGRVVMFAGALVFFFGLVCLGMNIQSRAESGSHPVRPGLALCLIVPPALLSWVTIAGGLSLTTIMLLSYICVGLILLAWEHHRLPDWKSAAGVVLSGAVLVYGIEFLLVHVVGASLS
jgi:hypothetical protein